MNAVTQKTIMSSSSDEWSTPDNLFNSLHEIFNFNLDAAASPENKKVNNFFHKDFSALNQEWNVITFEQSRAWLNPPYSKPLQGKFLEKAWNETCIERNCSFTVALIPARTDTIAFHKYCFKASYILFIKSRLKFSNHKDSAPFPSCLVFMGSFSKTQMEMVKDLGLGELIKL